MEKKRKKCSHKNPYSSKHKIMDNFQSLQSQYVQTQYGLARIVFPKNICPVPPRNEKIMLDEYNNREISKLKKQLKRVKRKLSQCKSEIENIVISEKKQQYGSFRDLRINSSKDNVRSSRVLTHNYKKKCEIGHFTKLLEPPKYEQNNQQSNYQELKTLQSFNTDKQQYLQLFKKNRRRNTDSLHNFNEQYLSKKFQQLMTIQEDAPRNLRISREYFKEEIKNISKIINRGGQ